jgi:hypothetical protein
MFNLLFFTLFKHDQPHQEIISGLTYELWTSLRVLNTFFDQTHLTESIHASIEVGPR